MRGFLCQGSEFFFFPFLFFSKSTLFFSNSNRLEFDSFLKIKEKKKKKGRKDLNRSERKKKRRNPQ